MAGLSEGSLCLPVCVVAQSSQILFNPMDGSLLGSSIHGIFQTGVLEVCCHFLLQGIFLTQGSNLCLQCSLHCRWILYLLSHWEIQPMPRLAECLKDPSASLLT